MTATLWASPADWQRLEQASSALFLVGGYDGSGNYGDVLQFAATLEAARGIPGAPLVAAVIEREPTAHSRLVARHAAQLGDAVFLHYSEGGTATDELVELRPGVGPARSAIHLYGGGYLNGWWGARKAHHVEAVDRLVGRRALPLVASGLQVEEASVAPGGIGHDLLARAARIGVRDIRSLEFVRAHIPGADRGGAELAGDDAVPALLLGPQPAEDLVNLHLNDGSWVSDDPAALADGALSALCDLARAVGTGLDLQPVVAYEDPRISETAQAEALLRRRGESLEAAGLRPLAPLNVLDDAFDDRLARFRRARLTVSCSYHVALTSLVAGIPTILLAENDYYDQKAAGLRDLFGLDASLVGVPVAQLDLEAMRAVASDGPARTALIDHLHEAAARVVERQARGREAVSAALARAVERRRRLFAWAR